MVDPVMLVVLAASLASAGIAGLLLARSGRGGLEGALRDEMRLGREEAARAAREQREEGARAAAALRDEVARSTGAVRDAVDQRLRELRAANEEKLEQMRRTVDERLHDTLEKRLGESFRTVSLQLEAVHKGLGEMQGLASGVGDLKRVLTNVKTRGTWGEVQLGAILEQVLVPEQYERNVATRPGSRERVEFAVRLPGNGEVEVVHLPIDSKFPMEDYERLVQASEAGDAPAVQKAAEDLARAVRKSAQDIRDKYLASPHTTDFAILFLPTEGLFAEVLRQPGLAGELQQVYRVVVTGPTTLAATLSSLRMGFRTLALEKRAGEAWEVLSAVKTEFGKFGTVLDKLKRQLETASATVEETGTRSRAMARRLSKLETMPEDEARALLDLAASAERGREDEDEA